MTYYPQKRTITGAVDMIAAEYPDIFKRLDDVYIAATSKASKWWNPQGYENKLVCRDYFGMPIPAQRYDELRLVQQSYDARQRVLDDRARKAEYERNRRRKKAAAAGKEVRGYRKRK